MVNKTQNTIIEEGKSLKIYFEDKGQDFLSWTLDKKGFVIDSEPFQRSIWYGTRVLLISLREGLRPILVLKEELENMPLDVSKKKLLEKATELNYRVIKIEELKGGLKTP